MSGAPRPARDTRDTRGAGDAGDAAARLVDAYLALLPEGRRPAAAIHPADEMALFAVDAGAPAERVPLHYMIAGREVALVLEHFLARRGRSLADCGSVLDFACGYGRVARHLARAVPPGRLSCAEIVPEAVAWTARTFGARALPSHADPARVDLGGPHDLIWVGSLFTHLPRERFAPWLAALHGALAPGGALLFTLHRPDLCPPERRSPDGFTFVRESESRVLSRDEYGATWVEPDVVRALAREAGIAELARLEGEAWGMHDVWAAPRGDAPELAGWTHAPRALGAVERADVDAERWAWVGGWAVLPASAGTLAGVDLHLDGGPPVPALVGPSRPHAGPGVGGAGGFLRAEWYVEGRLPATVPPGRHPLLAVARLSGGERCCFDGRSLEVPRG